jgi:5-oxoprolinase (ATP-hydrolysing) subunit A
MSGPIQSIDLNADLGEGYPDDAALLARVTSASVSCGAHAGDSATILATLREAKARGVSIGAHPGFADREGFGRRERDVDAAEVERLILEQIEALAALALAVGLPLRFVKPHGALYNQAQRQPHVAEGVIAALARRHLPVLGQPRSVLEARAKAQGVRFVAEGFPERRYRPNGRLVPRDEKGAVLTDPDEIEAQVVWLIEQGVATLCIHGDDPHAVEKADRVRAVLRRHRIAPKGFV